jgi:hypothetical protein
MTSWKLWQRHASNVTKGNGLNKAIVFEALSAAGITRVLVNFDGAGDSGQIEDANAYAGDKLVDFPATTVTLYRQQYGNEKLTTHEMSLSEAVEELPTAISNRKTAAGKTTTARLASSPSMWRNGELRSISTGGSPITFNTNTRFEGGDHGTSLPPLAFQREEMGRHGRRLPTYP